MYEHVATCQCMCTQKTHCIESSNTSVYGKNVHDLVLNYRTGTCMIIIIAVVAIFSNISPFRSMILMWYKLGVEVTYSSSYILTTCSYVMYVPCELLC